MAKMQALLNELDALGYDCDEEEDSDVNEQ